MTKRKPLPGTWRVVKGLDPKIKIFSSVPISPDNIEEVVRLVGDGFRQIMAANPEVIEAHRVVTVEFPEP